jgi:integrase
MKKTKKLIWSTKDASGKPLERGILRRSDGKKFRARIVRLIDGKPTQFTKTTDTISEAKRAKTKLEQDYKEGGKQKLDADRITFRHLATEYSDWKLVPPIYDNPDSDNRKKKKGLVSYEEGKRAIRLFIDHFGNRLIKSITWEDIEAWIMARLQEPKQGGGKRPYSFWPRQQRSSLSINREVHFLRACFRFAIDRKKYLTTSPFDGANLFTDETGTERDRALTKAEEDQLLATLENDPSLRKHIQAARDYLRMYLIFMFYTGAHHTEAQRLQRRDIDFSIGKLGEVTLRATTTKTSIKRHVTILTPQLRDVLEQRLQLIADEPTALVFPIESVDKSFNSAVQRAGITNFRLGDCRHTALSRWAAMKIPANIAMKWSGHTQFKTYLRYVNMHDDIREQSVKLAAAYMAEYSAPQTAAFVN